MRTLAERERRLAKARFASNLEIVLGTLAVVAPVAWVIADPTTFEPLWGHMYQFWVQPLQVIAYGLVVLGYAWMLKIRFTGPEDGARSNWRSH